MKTGVSATDLYSGCNIGYAEIPASFLGKIFLGFLSFTISGTVKSSSGNNDFYIYIDQDNVNTSGYSGCPRSDIFVRPFNGLTEYYTDHMWVFRNTDSIKSDKYLTIAARHCNVNRSFDFYNGKLILISI